MAGGRLSQVLKATWSWGTERMGQHKGEGQQEKEPGSQKKSMTSLPFLSTSPAATRTVSSSVTEFGSMGMWGGGGS